MLFIRGPTDLSLVEDRELRDLLSLRLSQLCNGDPDEAVLVLVEQADTLETLEEETGLAIATNPFDDTRYPDLEFSPIWEWAEEHESCWECAFVTSDSSSTTLFVPRHSAIHPQLVALCEKFAEPALEPNPP